MKKQVGIWLDFDKAHLVFLEGSLESETKIESMVDHFNLKGGAGTSTPYGIQDAVSESKLLERKKHQVKNYYNRIMNQINDYDEIYVLGPAEAKFGLEKTINALHDTKAKLKKVEAFDTMTENQIKAQVRKFFKSN